MTSPEIERRTGLSGAVALKAPVKVATTVNITLVGEQTINGVAVVDGDRVLVKNQTAGADNGIWIASTGDWQRAPDWDANGDVVEGTQVFVTDGSVSPGVLYYVTTADDIVIGTTSVAFSATNFLAGLTSWDAVAAQGTDVASEASLNLDSVTGPILNLTGTIAVTSITLAVGHLRFIRAAAASSFTASANLIVNGSASVSKTNAANDQLVILGGAAGVVYVASIGSAGITFATIAEALAGASTTKAVNPAGLAGVLYAGTDNVGGATITMGDGGYFNLITSTIAITAFAFTTDAVGRTAKVRFNTVRTLTHNGTSLILPGAANITTAVGDIAQVRSLGSGNFVVEWYTRASGSDITLGTSIASTSGTALDFTGIPSWVNEVTVEFVGVSTNGSSNYMVQMGSGSVQTSGYSGAGGNTGGSANFTTGFGAIAGAGTVVMHGIFLLRRVTGNTWAASHGMGRSDAASISGGGGSVTLSGAVDRIRVTTVNGTDTFDLGTVNISYQ